MKLLYKSRLRTIRVHHLFMVLLSVDFPSSRTLLYLTCSFKVALLYLIPHFKFDEEITRLDRSINKINIWSVFGSVGFRMFGLFTLLEAGLLMVNAIAVLHEERFLVKYGWTDDTQHGFGDPGIKVQIMRLIKAIRTVMRGNILTRTTLMETKKWFHYRSL